MGTSLLGKATFSAGQRHYHGNNNNDNITAYIQMFNAVPGTYKASLKYLTSSGTCSGTQQLLGMITIGSNGYGQFSFTGPTVSGTHEFDVTIHNTETSYAQSGAPSNEYYYCEVR